MHDIDQKSCERFSVIIWMQLVLSGLLALEFCSTSIYEAFHPQLNFNHYHQWISLIETEIYITPKMPFLISPSLGRKSDRRKRTQQTSCWKWYLMLSSDLPICKIPMREYIANGTKYFSLCVSERSRGLSVNVKRSIIWYYNNRLFCRPDNKRRNAEGNAGCLGREVWRNRKTWSCSERLLRWWWYVSLHPWETKDCLYP